MLKGLKVEKLNYSNCSTSQQLNTSTSDGDAIRVDADVKL
jgi:hypothetical protein